MRILFLGEFLDCSLLVKLLQQSLNICGPAWFEDFTVSDEIPYVHIENREDTSPVEVFMLVYVFIGRMTYGQFFWAECSSTSLNSEFSFF